MAYPEVRRRVRIPYPSFNFRVSPSLFRLRTTIFKSNPYLFRLRTTIFKKNPYLFRLRTIIFQTKPVPVPSTHHHFQK